MKRKYAVTVVVEVQGNKESDFKAAIEELKLKGLWYQATCVGTTADCFGVSEDKDLYSYSARARKGARVRRILK